MAKKGKSLPPWLQGSKVDAEPGKKRGKGDPKGGFKPFPKKANRGR